MARLADADHGSVHDPPLKLIVPPIDTCSVVTLLTLAKLFRSVCVTRN